MAANMARTLALLALLFVCCVNRIFALDPTSHISQYGHSAWRVQDGYLGAMPWAITQTVDGYIWVGTDAGLFRFDGVRFVRWNSPSGEELPSSGILDVLGARDGSLWIGTFAGLAHLLNNRLVVYQKNEGWTISKIFEDRDGKIWFMRIRADDKTHPLCEVIDIRVRCYGSEDGVDVFAIGAIAQDRSGDLWVGGSTTFLRWRPGESKVYRPKALQSNEGNLGVGALLPAADGSLWIGMALAVRGAGLQHMVDGTLKPFLAPNLNGETMEVDALCSDRQNSVWVGTTTHGLYRIRGTDVDHYESADGLSSDWARRIFEDREGNLWVVTSRGIDLFRDLRVKSISKREGLTEAEANSVAASLEGDVWIGASHLQMFGHHGVFYDFGHVLPGNTVASLFVDHADRLWVGMVNRLFVRERGSFRQITKPDGSATGMAAGIAEDSEHNIWVQTLGPPGTLFRIRDFKIVQEFAAPQAPLARKLLADPQGGIWLGLVTGDMARYHSGQFSVFTFGDHPHSRVQALARTSDGAILGGTTFGVVAWKSGKQQILTTRNGLPCDAVNGVISDGAGNLWLYAQCGLIEIAFEQMQLWWEHPESKLNVRVFDTFDGVDPGLAYFNTSAKTPDGRLWFANGSVVQVVDPAHIPENTLPPPVHVNAIIADRKSYSLEGTIHLPPFTRDLEIDYTALSFGAPQKVRFRYMLEGHDAGWQEPGTRRQAFYNDLRPGGYRFRVIACNSDGVWNEAGASFGFSILPAYYQTSWFIASCLAASLVLLWCIYRLRIRQVQRNFANAVEVRVDERTRIARELHDTVLQSLHGLLMSFQRAANLLPERPVEAKQRLEGAIDQAAQAITEGREAVQGLRSSIVVTNDLALAIQTLGEELAAKQTTQNPPVLNVAVEGTLRDLNPILRDDVYRIAGEALRNAYHHAQARRIEAEIRFDDNELRVRVRDDGKGISAQLLSNKGRPGHWGLKGMRERAKLVGGHLEIWSELDSGTEMELRIPASIAYLNSAAGNREKAWQ